MPYENSCHPTALALGVLSLGDQMTPQDLMVAAGMQPGELPSMLHMLRMDRLLLKRGYQLEWVCRPDAEGLHEKGLSLEELQKRQKEYAAGKTNLQALPMTEAEYAMLQAEQWQMQPYRESGQYSLSYDPELGEKFRPGTIAVGKALIATVSSDISLHAVTIMPAICKDGRASSTKAYRFWPPAREQAERDPQFIKPMTYSHRTVERDLVPEGGLLVISKR